MGRVAKGNIYFEGGRWKARITMPDGKRPIVKMPFGMTEDEARAEAERMSTLVRVQVADVGPSAPFDEETFAQYATRIVAWKFGRGQETSADTRGRLKNWVEPIIGREPIRGVTSAQLREVVRHLDAAVAAKKISAKTADNVWGDVTGLFKQAQKSKEPTLKVRDDDPTRDVLGPDAGIEKRKPVLFADESMRLLACEKVPRVRRRLYALAIYLAARANELAALTAQDFDLVHSSATIARQRDRKTNADKQTKTKRIRSTDIEPELVPLIEMLVAARPKGRLFPDEDRPTDEERATMLRVDLLTAGIARAELHKDDDPQHLPLWFHHLRDTGLTWMAVRGDDPLRIQWRGGHTDFKTTQKYIAQGRMLAVGAGFRRVPPFPPLPDDLLNIGVDSAADGPDPAAKGGVPNGIRTPFRVGRASNAGLSGAADGLNAPAGNRSAVGTAVPARRLRGGEMHPRDGARLARHGAVAAGVWRAIGLAKVGDEKATHTEMLHVIGLKWGGQ